MKELVSIVVPCYNESEALPIFIGELQRIMNSMQEQDFEVIFVNDGSKDDTLQIMKNLAEKDTRIKYISLSRNFGKEAAIFAGFEYARGDYVVMMDADLQDPPSLLPEMYQAVAEEGYDSVATRRVSRKGEPPVRSFFARCFYKLMNKMSSTEIVDGARDYRLMNRQFVNALLSMKEYNRFSKGLFGWVGFKNKWIEFENVERIAGETKWSFWSLFKYSIEGIVAFTTKPLVLSSLIGLMMCGISFCALIYMICRGLIYGTSGNGWASLVCIIVFVGGIELFCMGIIGQYMAKMYLEIKRRPIYIVAETNIKKMLDDKEKYNNKDR